MPLSGAVPGFQLVLHNHASVTPSKPTSTGHPLATVQVHAPSTAGHYRPGAHLTLFLDTRADSYPLKDSNFRIPLIDFSKFSSQVSPAEKRKTAEGNDRKKPWAAARK